MNKVAERAGFEPAVRVIPVRRFSKPVLSTTQPSLRTERRGNNELGFEALSKENIVLRAAFLHSLLWKDFDRYYQDKTNLRRRVKPTMSSAQSYAQL